MESIEVFESYELSLLSEEVERLRNKCGQDQAEEKSQISPGTELEASMEQEKNTASQDFTISVSNHNSAAGNVCFMDGEHQENVQTAQFDKNILSGNEPPSSPLSSLDDKFFEVEDVQQAAGELKRLLTKSVGVEPEVKGKIEHGSTCVNGNNEKVIPPFCNGILVVGKNAAEIWELSLKDIFRESVNEHPSVIKVDGELATLLPRAGLQTYVNASILDANKAAGSYYLVLENFKEKQIMDLYGKDFIGKVLQVHSRLVNIIFLCSCVDHLERFESAGAKIILSEFQKDSDIRQITSPGASVIGKETEQVRNDGVGDQGSNPESEVKRNKCQTPDAIIMKESVTSNMQNKGTEKVFQNLEEKIPGAFSEPTFKALLAKFQDKLDIPSLGESSTDEKEEAMEFEQAESQGLCKTCLFGFLQSVYEIIAQCGDCCFY